MLEFKNKVKTFFPPLLPVDITLFIISYAASYLLRFDMGFPREQYLQFRNTLIPFVLLKVSIFYYLGLYRSVWCYTSVKDLEEYYRSIPGQFSVRYYLHFHCLPA